MDSRSLHGGCSAAVVAALVLGLAGSSASAETTLWLVRPLYPGQEALVDRTEKALDKLMPGDARKGAVIGVRELAEALKGRHVDDVPCFSAEARCPDPLDPFVRDLGFDRVVLIQGGQDEAGFKYRVVNYEPASGRAATPASASANSLEKALLGAVAKVVPAASTLEVKSNPSGATVYVDDVKVGVTPLSTQVLPGERVVKLDLKLHQPIEESLVIPIRGAASVEHTLEKVAARIIITAAPAGAEISIDGAVLGQDKVDRGIAPGTHTIRVTAEKHKSYEQLVEVKADREYTFDKTLEPVPGPAAPLAVAPTVVSPNITVVVPDQNSAARVFVAPPPPPPTETELTYERKGYFQVSYEFGRLLGNKLVGRRWGNAGTGRTEYILSAPTERNLMGASVEYGTFGKYFGLTLIGVSYLTNIEHWGMSVGFAPGTAAEIVNNNPTPDTIDPVRLHLLVIHPIQPQFRIAVWRFMFALQVGLDVRTGLILETNTPPAFPDGFVVLDLLLAGRLNIRFFIVEGFYAFAQGNFAYYLWGAGAPTNNGIASGHSWGVNGGLGYGF
jgi:hypothetical protein